ncbi:MAG: MMPL family transporter [Planctomycetes bacterium]|nr:MMPL family transporter [Planctomycetota bacterium]
MTLDSRTLLRRAGWLLFLSLLGLAAIGMLRQQVDPANQALKDPHGAAARARAQLAEVVPDDPVLLLAFATRGGLELTEADRRLLGELVARIDGMPGVQEAQVRPVPDHGLLVGTVSLESGDAFATAERIVAKADREAPPTVVVHATGLPLLEGTLAARIARERQTLVPIVVLVLAACAAVFYRHWALTVAALLPALAAIVTMGGLLGWLGHRLDPIATLLDPVLLTIGVAGSVHFVQAFRLLEARGASRDEAARTATQELLHPALLATGTTLLGLWSLLTSTVPAVADFGIRAALGVALAHVYVFWLLPPWLVRFAPATVSPQAVAPDRGLGFRWLQRHRVAILVGTAAITAALATGLSRLRSDNDPLRLLPTTERARADHDTLAARLGGVETCHLLVPPDSPAADPSRLLPFLAELRLVPGIAGLAGAVARSPEGALAVPLLLQPGGSAVRAPLFADVERTALALGLDEVVVAGPAVQMARDSHQLLDSLGWSMLASIALLAVAMMLGLRSWRRGLLALVPNLLPATWIYGALAWCDRPVSVATALIGSTMLGVIVDNTLHLLHTHAVLRRSLAPADALHAALVRCGPATRLSSLVLIAGFLSTATSRLGTTVEFAIVAVATIAIAWFGTVVVVPLLLSHDNPTAGRPAQPREPVELRPEQA